MWDEIRANSAVMTRMAWHRGGTSSFASFSTAIAYAMLLASGAR